MMNSVVAPRCTSVKSFDCHSVRTQQSLRPLRWHRKRLQCQAAQKGEKGEGGGINWDAEWKKAKARLPEVPVENVSSRRSTPRSRVGRDSIRDQENAVLDIYSQESFFKVHTIRPLQQCAQMAQARLILAIQVGGAVVVFLVLFFVFVIGPPEG